MAVLLGLGTAGQLAAQSRVGAISGQLADSAGRPLQLTTVWLVPADTALRSSGTLTDGKGGFVFEGLSPGRYYLRVDRPGFLAEWSEAKRLAPGQRLRLAVTSAPKALRIGLITAAGRCLSGAEIGRDTVLAALWGEARKAAAARRLYDLSYSYDVRVLEDLQLWSDDGWSAGRGRRKRHKLTSTPALARPLLERGSWAGFNVGMDSTRLVAVRELLQVLTEPFARSHCLAVLPDRRGRHRIHFEPLNSPLGVTELAGTILLDESYRLRRIEFEYRMGGWATSRGREDFGGDHEAGPLRFLSSMVVWVFDAPATLGDRFDTGFGKSGLRGKERALVWATYGGFRREGTGP